MYVYFYVSVHLYVYLKRQIIIEYHFIGVSTLH